MKILLTFLTFFLGLYAHSQNPHHSIIKQYADGTIKEVFPFNDSNIIDGEALFYNETGALDSSVSFKNGKLDGLTKVYYSADDIFYFEYQNNLLVNHKIYDSSHHLKYESPLNLKRIPKTTYKFTSGRNYYDQSKMDTLTINHDVPFMNQHIYFPGATVLSIDKYSWAIKSWKPQPNSDKGKMVVNISEFGVEDSHVSQPQKLLREEIILVPIK